MEFVNHMERKKMNYKTIFCSLFFSASLSSMDSGALILELLTKNILHFDHTVVCAIARVTTEFNKLIKDQAGYRRELLQPYVDGDPDRISREKDRYVVWHRYGSSCGFIAPNNRSSYNVPHNDYKIQLCCLQLDTNKIMVRYAKPFMYGAQYEPKFNEDEHGEQMYECPRRFDHDMTIIMLPSFNKHGDLCTYIQSSYHEIGSGNNVKERRITPAGKEFWRNTYIEYMGKKYALTCFFLTGLVTAFTRSKDTKESDTEIIFLASGVCVKGKPLSAEHHETIRSICEIIDQQREVHNLFGEVQFLSESQNEG
jgi:hypothetical protein